MKPFQVTTYGKWILAGEHAVLRGSPALVFPLKSCSLSLSFTPGDSALRLELTGTKGAELEPLFWAVLERACDLMRMPKSALRGLMRIESSIPLGAGLGASAAFCVAMTRWFQSQNWVRETDMYEFARTLENLFHGESSGVDIAVALTGEGLHFEREGQRFQLLPRWSPRWYISSSGQRGITSEAVRRVKQMFLENPEKARLLDEQMRQAVLRCEEALLMSDESVGFRQLRTAMSSANECFQAWGLAEGAVSEHMSHLLQAGAAAVKPTGSGGGGYVLSLWEQAPPASLATELISCS